VKRFSSWIPPILIYFHALAQDELLLSSSFSDESHYLFDLPRIAVSEKRVNLNYYTGHPSHFDDLEACPLL